MDSTTLYHYIKIGVDELYDHNAVPLRQRRCFAFHFKFHREISVPSSQTTTSSTVEKRYVVSCSRFSADLARRLIANTMLLPPDLTEIVARNVSSFAYEWAEDPLEADSAVMPIAVYIATSGTPYVNVGDGEMAEAAFEGVTPASRSAVAALKEVRLEGDDDSTCIICLEELSQPSSDHQAVVVLSMPCSHLYHKDCILRWLQTSYMCPLCRCALPTDS